MARSDPRNVVHAYLVGRLREECVARGRAAAIAQATGFTPAHISRVLRGKAELGDLFAAALLALWKLDRHTIEQGRVVSGRERERVLPPNLQAAVEFCAPAYPAEFMAEIERRARRLGVDRSRAAWVMWIDVKFWDWKQKSRQAPERSGTFPWDSRGARHGRGRKLRSAG